MKFQRNMWWLAIVVLGWLASGAASAETTVVYYHTDALGSPVATTDANGNIIERTEYEPYGKVLNRPLEDGPGYTGHVSDAATGLSYMQQRYYDPGIGRFLSVDPVTADGNTGSNFNRYWYAMNNPYRFIDPDGRYTCDTPATCKVIATFRSAALVSMNDSRQSMSGHRRISHGLDYIGTENSKGPKYVSSKIDGLIGASTDLHGTVIVDLSKLTNSEIGAVAILHEAGHDIYAFDHGDPTKEEHVRAMEEDAYDLGEAVQQGFGKSTTPATHRNNVNGSVEYWKIQQKEEAEERRRKKEEDNIKN